MITLSQEKVNLFSISCDEVTEKETAFGYTIYKEML